MQSSILSGVPSCTVRKLDSQQQLRPACLTASPLNRHSAQSGLSSVGRGHTQLPAACPASRAGGRVRQSLRTRAQVFDNPAPGQYDYIIVGGGTAGCVLANRLTADGTKNVLVLEAGLPNGDKIVKIPAGITRLFQSHLDWNLYSNKQDQLHARQVYSPRGKLLGGSSSTNATLYHRGTAQDYDNWGIENWGARDVLDWFIRCENNDNGAVTGIHGIGGTMHVENPRYHNELHDVFFEAAKQYGLKHNPDFNDWGTQQEGYGEFQVTQEKGERADMYRQYMKPAEGRSNLTVVTQAKTLKVEMEHQGGRPVARGVHFSTRNPANPAHQAELKPGGEVLMCAGAVHTPQLLQLSGIGGADHLRKFGIDVLSDLPGMGRNLQDHPAAINSFTMREEKEGISVTDHIYRKSGQIRVRALTNYALRRRGPLTTTACDHGAFMTTQSQAQPDLQIRFAPASALVPDGVETYAMFGRLKEEGKKWPSGFSFQLVAIRPQSRDGYVQLRTTDPWDAPDLSIGYFTDKRGEDIATLRNGVQIARKMAKMDAFRDYLKDEVWPGSHVQTDGELDEYLKGSVHSANALIGSCQMGSDVSKGAVVDSQLRVHGAKNLRVIDASVIPIIPGAQTGAATVMVAERAAAMIMGQTVPKPNEPARFPEPVAA
ncbi:hypothetical protein WJX74_006865 [Apatococcus lobatus]|uniref:Glucose-methanol-choline oxidoreductase N-terminal domain-containing protein n=1 Tax=Apatococcus lobatus TaxID=904363 RepID=A0AAW1S052_9CHLO